MAHIITTIITNPRAIISALEIAAAAIIGAAAIIQARRAD